MAYSTFEPKGNRMDALPGARKHSSKSPTIIMQNGRPWAAIGSPGGHTIPQTVAQLAINLIDFEMDLQTAVDSPRIAFAAPDVLVVDQDIPESVRAELAAMGHTVRRTPHIGLPHALRIEYDEGGQPVRFIGAADSSGPGTAVGLDAAPAQ
jgi:gamma-glutamyltranspeptidase/glutathione hydrolase